LREERNWKKTNTASATAMRMRVGSNFMGKKPFRGV
jgi:hypothetical protein